MDNIYLIGFMGTGKTTVAKGLSKFLPFQIVEMDETIARLEEMSIPDIFSNRGEEAFRTMETQLLKAISPQKNQIVSCGGGIVLRDENIEIMQATGTVCLLEASAQTIYDRVYNDENRPLLKGKKSVEDIQVMLDSRAEAYEKAAKIKVNVDTLSPEEVAGELISKLALIDALH